HPHHRDFARHIHCLSSQRPNCRRHVCGYARWRGSFWMMAPLMLAFAGIAYWKIPDRLSREVERKRLAGVPFLRFATLAAGVLCVGASGSVPGIAPRVLLIAAAVPLVGVTFWLDRRAPDNLFP